MFQKLSLILIVALAATTQARRHHPGHLHRRANDTIWGTGTGNLVTSTVYTTQEITITSCAPTVTKCSAANATHVIVTTVTVAAYVTLCPATVSLSPYSSPISALPVSLSSLLTAAAATATSSVALGTAPVDSAAVSATDTAGAVVPSSSLSAVSVLAFSLGTGVSTVAPLSTGSASSSEAAGVDSVSLSTAIGNSTLTYTLGNGTSRTVVTTTVRRTSTIRVLKTGFASSASTSTASPLITGSAAGDAGFSAPIKAVDLKEPTTTITSTATVIFTRTLRRVSSSVSASATGGPATGGASVSEGLATGGYPVPEGPSTSGYPVSEGPVTAGCLAPSTVTVTAAVTVTATTAAVEASSIPSGPVSFSSAPYGNGTSTTSTLYGSTGFLTVGTAVPSNINLD